MRTMGTRGMVASPHYLATGAGLQILRRGGSAVDAAVGTNAVLAVVAPTMCGLGGDLFALVYSSAGGALEGLNGSGRSAGEATVERVRSRVGGSTLPPRDPLTVTVPGCVDAWERLHGRFGRLPWADLFADAVSYAESGFPITEQLARSLALQEQVLHPDTPAVETFVPGGRLPVEGEILRQPRLARTLQTIAMGGAEPFYRGEIGAEIVRSLRAVGGLLSEQDLALHTADWVEPLSVTYRDVTVYELPPNSQGVVALQMLGMLQHVPSEVLSRGDAEYIHLLAEAARMACRDREAFITDSEHMTVEPAALLAPVRLQERAGQLSEQDAAPSSPAAPGDTAYMCAADAEGSLVSLIQSNYMGIGSGVMAGETGIMLQNRGAYFSLDRGHVNVIGPRKRTMHTLMPAMAFRGREPWLVFGTMGGSAQPQIHVQLLTRLLDAGMKLDQALDAPRFDAVQGSDKEGRPVLALEDRFSPEVVEDLRLRGHGVRLLEPYSSAVGHAHAIQLLESGVYVGAADPRTHSLALGY